jgi:hypothetical protein
MFQSLLDAVEKKSWKASPLLLRSFSSSAIRHQSVDPQSWEDSTVRFYLPGAL